MSNSIDKRITASCKVNQKFFNELSEGLVGTKQVINSHRSTVINLIEFINHRPLFELTLEDVDSFLKTSDNMNYHNTRAEHLKKLFIFLETKFPLPFSNDAIDSLKYDAATVKENTPKPIPLSFEEIITIRNTLKAMEKYDWWLTFELCYQLGEKKQENIPLYNTSSYQPEQRAFLIKKKIVPVPAIIEDLISKGALPKPKMSKETFYKKIKEIERLLGRKIEWRDIIETRKLNFIVCPRCKNPYENKPENWVVYEYQEDSSRWLVCKPVCYYEVYNARN